MLVSNPSAEAVALAGKLTGLHGDRALGRARMRLYAALNDQEPSQVDLLAQTCHVLMQGECQVKTGRL